MANHLSAFKRDRQNKKRRARNRAQRSKVRTHVKKVLDLIAAGDAEQAQKELVATQKVIDTVAQHGVLKKNNASRKIARLSKKVHQLSASA